MMIMIVTMMLSMNVSSAQRVTEVTSDVGMEYRVSSPEIHNGIDSSKLRSDEGNNGIMPRTVRKHW